jgi:hypothetical protein
MADYIGAQPRKRVRDLILMCQELSFGIGSTGQVNPWATSRALSMKSRHRSGWDLDPSYVVP